MLSRHAVRGASCGCWTVDGLTASRKKTRLAIGAYRLTALAGAPEAGIERMRHLTRLAGLHIREEGITMLHLYRFLLRLYPARLVDEFGEEMAASCARCIAAAVLTCLLPAGGLACAKLPTPSGALREQFYGWNVNLRRYYALFLVDPRHDDPDFLHVNTAIEKGRLAAVQLSVGRRPHTGGICPVFMVVFAFLACVGLPAMAPCSYFEEPAPAEGLAARKGGPTRQTPFSDIVIECRN